MVSDRAVTETDRFQYLAPRIVQAQESARNGPWQAKKRAAGN
jgi:hypothetical protein